MSTTPTTETLLKKTQFIPFLDTKGTGTTAVWKRIIKSTIFDLALNAETESKDYISTEMPVEEVKKYAPELAQENELIEGDGIYDFIFNMFYSLPVGSACRVPCLLCFGGSGAKAWQTDATIVLGNLNTVDGKISYTIKIGGDIQRGTYTIEGGTPSFSAPSNDA